MRREIEIPVKLRDCEWKALSQLAAVHGCTPDEAIAQLIAKEYGHYSPSMIETKSHRLSKCHESAVDILHIAWDHTNKYRKSEINRMRAMIQNVRARATSPEMLRDVEWIENIVRIDTPYGLR